MMRSRANFMRSAPSFDLSLKRSIKRLDSDLSVLCVSVVNFPLCVRGGLRAFGPGDRVKPRDPGKTLKVGVSCVDSTVVGQRKCPELSVSDKVPAPPGVL